MPIYEYKCADGHEFEVFQRMADDPVTECEVCGKPVGRIFRPVAVHFKGSGFYTTDYAKKKSVPANSDGSGSKDSGSKESKSSDSKSSDSSSSSSSSSSSDSKSKASSDK